MNQHASWLKSLLLLLTLAFTLQVDAQTFEIGDVSSTTNSNVIPVNTNYPYSYAQQIFLAEDIGVSGTITAIRFYWTGSFAGLGNSDNWTIYMGHKTESSFTDTDDWLPFSELTEVFTGTVVLDDPITVAQWVEVTLSTPFAYDGSSNLVLAAVEEEPNYAAFSSTFRTTAVTGTGFRTIAYRNSATTPDPEDPPTGSNFGYNYYNNVQLDITPEESCEGAPTAGTLSAPSNICPAESFEVTNTGSIFAAGITRVWQNRVGTSAWTTIDGATGINYTNIGGISETTDYRCIVTCTESGEADTTNIASIIVNPATECYCIPAYTAGCGFNNDIDDVVLHGASISLTNMDTDCPAGGYVDYTDVDTLGIPDLIQGVTFLGNVTTNRPISSESVRIWIDYNDNGIFETAESVATLAFISSSDDGEFSLDVPVDAEPGAHRMRVRLVASVSPGFIDPCGSYNFGESHDYLVNVIEPEPCADATFPSATAAIASRSSICSMDNVSFDLDTLMPIATGITYQWKSSPTETGTFTNIGTPLSFGPEMELSGVATSLYYQCDVLCEGASILTSSSVYVEVVDIEDVSLTMTDGQTCGPGPVTLLGTTTEGDIFWYENETGGSPVGTGDTFETPSLTETVTYYATGGAYARRELEVANGTLSSSSSSAGLFSNYAGAKIMQMMYTVEQLNEAGATSEGNLTSVAFYMTSNPGNALEDYTIKIKTVPATETILNWQTTGWTEVYNNPSFTAEETGWITFPFDAAFDWNGIDNVVVQVCFTPDITSAFTTGGGHRYSNVMNQCMFYNSFSLTGTCSATFGSVYFNHLPSAQFVMAGCETERVAVTAFVRPVPAAVNIVGGDDTLCPNLDGTLTIDAGPQPEGYTFEWDNGETTQTRIITEAGTYSVAVANEFGCAVSDTVTKVFLESPEAALGNDTTFCEGGSIVLDAGDGGVAYFWNTGEDTPEITVDASGTYTVLVTNDLGCMSSDTVNIDVNTLMPGIESIVVTSLGEATYSFEALLPENVLIYSWDFGDGSPVSNDVSPSYTYTAEGDYTVTLTVSNDCEEVQFTVNVNVVGLNKIVIDESELLLYPNPARNIMTIENKGDLDMKSVIVSNIVGQTALTQTVDGRKVQLDLGRFAAGVYTVRIETDKGVVVRKFEVIK